MSGDMMQALSGSSLLSLSFGTLPAVKAGMNLDANPFASQLALMTGPDAAIGSGVARVASTDGLFALTLSDAGDTSLAPAAPAGNSTAIPAVDLTALPAGGQPAPAELPAPVATPRAAEIAALPENATPNEILEAVLNGTVPAAAKTKPAPVTQPVVDQSVASVAAKPVMAPPVANAAPVDEVATPVVADLAEDGEAVADTLSDAQPLGQRLRRAAKPAETAPVATSDPVVIAPVIAPVAVPMASTPDAPAPETGTTRIAVSAAPATAVARGMADGTTARPLPEAAPLAEASPVATAPMAGTPISAPVQPQGAGRAAPPAPIAAPRTQAEIVPGDMPVAASAPVAALPAQAIDLADPRSTLVHTAPQTATAQTSAGQIATTPLTSAQPTRGAAPTSSIAPVSVAEGAPAGSASIAPVPVPVPAPAMASAPAVDAAPVAAVVTPALVPDASVDAAPAAPPGVAMPAAAIGAVQTMTTVSRPAGPAPRAVAGASVHRLVQAAVQSGQPAPELATLLGLDGTAAEIAPGEGLAEAAALLRTDAVQPSWVSALNAVTTPTAGNGQGVQAVTAALANVAAPQAPLETLAFDAGFIGNIETQISRVANGGQMVRMQIMPEHLGRIDIEMLAGPDRDQVRLVTENDTVRDTLIQSQVRLEQDLRQNGQRNTDVTVELRQQSAGAQGGSAQQQQPRGQGGTDPSSARDTQQRQNTAAANEPQTPAQRRPRGNVRYA